MMVTSDVRVLHTDGTPLPLDVKRCDTLWCRFRGLMFRRRLAPREALLFVESGESRVATTIHMFFVFFSIGVVWLAGDGTVVDKRLARPFRPYYAPCRPAQYYLESTPDILNEVEIDEQLIIQGVPE